MFLRSPQQIFPPSVLQLTGQLTQMTQPAQQPPNLQHLTTHPPPASYLSSPQLQHFQETRQNFLHLPSQQQFITPKPAQHQQAQLQRLMVSFQKKVEKMEAALHANTRKINEQTLVAFDLLRNQIMGKLDTHDQVFIQRTHHLAQLEKKWDVKGKQQVKEAQTIAEEIQKEMQHKITKLLQEERVQAENLRKHKFEQLTTELQKGRAQAMEQMQVLEEKLRKDIKGTAKEQDKTRKQLEERLKEELEVLNNKMVELQETIVKQKMEKLVDRSTPFIRLFNIQHNTIMKQKGSGYHQILLDTVVPRKKFEFKVHIIHTHYGEIVIGVVDRETQAEKEYSHSSGNSVCYNGYSEIYYGQQGKYKLRKTGEELQGGIEVEVVVELSKGTVIFTLRRGTSVHQFYQSSDILTQPDRIFVPYFQMVNTDDMISWTIK